MPIVITGQGRQKLAAPCSAQQKPGVALSDRASPFCFHLISNVTHIKTRTLHVVGPTEATDRLKATLNYTAKLTSLQRRVHVERRLLNPGHYANQVLDKTGHDTTQHSGASSGSTQHFHLYFVGLRDHWKEMKACQYLQ